MLVALIGFGICANAQYSDPKVMQQKQSEATSQTKANDGKTVTTTQSSCTTVGGSFGGNGGSTKTCVETKSDGSKTTTTTSCTTKGVDVGFGKAVKEDCKTTTVNQPASSNSSDKPK